ncbi:MAG: C25 family cysteine peptidase [Candidatus Stygibacter australis]|nr:C25 family cysteine peptidase [Candidatus Stygibacter australis]MDP8323064.1 C25 family cysteine peptidase [Candidatus Stygibacter australis]
MTKVRINRNEFLVLICMIMFTLLSYDLLCVDTLGNQDVIIPEKYSADAETIITAMENTKHEDSHQELRDNRLLSPELVIITTDALETDFEEFAELKTEEGIVTEIFTLTTTGTTSTAIRSWLETRKTTYASLQYVIIGGSIDLVPAHQIVYDHAGSTISASTDFYYSNVLSAWPQNDDIMAIVTDIDLYVGRLPVRNSDEVENFITKYRNYRTNYIDNTDRMSFISTNVPRDASYDLYDSYVSDIMTHTGANIVNEFLLCEDLVDIVNGAATEVVNVLQDRDYSFLYGVWHGVDQFTILDSEFDHNDSAYLQGFGPHMQSLSINTNRVEEGSCEYGEEINGEWQYFYTISDECYLQLEDVLPETYGNTYVTWIASCRTMDLNYVSFSQDCARDEQDEIICNLDENGWSDYWVNTAPVTVYNDENCINEVFFNQVGGPVAIYASSTTDYPSISRFIVQEYMDLQFIDDEHTMGFITNEAWNLYDNLFSIYLYKLIFLGHTLFGDPSMDVWSAEAKQLVLSKNIRVSPESLWPEFEVFDTQGNPVEALVSVIDDVGVLQGRGMSPFQYNGTVGNDWVISANKANYVHDIREYSYLKTNDTVPYSMGFEDGLDKNWRVESDLPYGRILVTSENSPHSGNMHLTMDTNTNYEYAHNSADLHLNLTGEDRLMLDFWWKEFYDEDNDYDGVFISDDNGDNFTKIYSLINGIGWENIMIDLDAAIYTARLEYNNNFIIRFQQYDNFPISSDGFAFDDIQVYSMYADLPYSTGFESGLDGYWDTESSNAHGYIEVTSENMYPHGGQEALVMAGDGSGTYVYNRAFLYLNLENETDVELDFWWNDYNDEYQAGDGIYLSKNGGMNFVKVHNLNGETHANKVWTNIVLDISAIAANLTWDLNSHYVIKFQHYDNEIINEDGFAFDDIQVYSSAREKSEENFGNAVTSLKSYPNPFNPQTTLSFNLNENTEINLSVYNIKGQLVRELINEHLEEGNHSVIWDGRNASGKTTSTGIYFARLKARNLDITKKIILIK